MSFPRASKRVTAAVAALSLVCTGVTVFITQQTANAAACPKVMFVGVRGSSEAPGLGGTVKSTFETFKAGTRKSVGSHALVYPASTVPIVNKGASVPAFVDSVTTGKTAFAKYIKAQHAKCPSQRFVISGYSQGALVIGEGMKDVPAATRAYVDAIVLYGDPRFDKKFAGNAGTYDKGDSGIFPRLPTYVGGAPYYSADLAPKVKSYCVAYDPVCNFSTVSLTNCLWIADVCSHARYIEWGYTRQGGQFLASKE